MIKSEKHKSFKWERHHEKDRDVSIETEKRAKQSVINVEIAQRYNCNIFKNIRILIRPIRFIKSMCVGQSYIMMMSFLCEIRYSPISNWKHTHISFSDRIIYCDLCYGCFYGRY